MDIKDKEMVMAEGDLPKELIHEILLRLPVKSLLRFMRVSNWWCTTISDPHFARSKHDHSQNAKPVLLSTKYKARMAFTIYRLHLFFACGKEFGASLHNQWAFDLEPGVLLSSYRGSLLCYVGNNDITICNPNTRQLLTIPNRYSSRCFMAGFLYLPEENEYKVVRLLDEMKACEIFTLRDGCEPYWRVIRDVSCPYGTYSYHHASAAANGSFYWLVKPDARFNESNDDKLIVSFNLNSEKFEMVPAPRGCLASPYGGLRHLRLTEASGFLVLTARYQESEVDMWVLRDYENGLWVKEYRIDVSEMDGFRSNYFRYAIPMGIHDGEMLVQCDPDNFAYYNVATRSFKMLTVPDVDFEGRDTWTRLHFVWESLFSLGPRRPKDGASRIVSFTDGEE